MPKVAPRGTLASLELGSHVRVTGRGLGLIAKGYILRHRSGEIFILKSKKEAKDDTICGGCCGDAIGIDIGARKIWGC